PAAPQAAPKAAAPAPAKPAARPAAPAAPAKADPDFSSLEDEMARLLDELAGDLKSDNRS
ncbi:hypothetical protein, partial [Oharaeibacter diazotrophicus]